MLPPRTASVQPGWAFSTLVVVPEPASSWTHVLDNRRRPSDRTAAQVGAQQLAAVVPLLAERPVCLADGVYATAAWVRATAEVACDQLVRAAATRVLYYSAPPPTGRRGRPALDGPRFQGRDPATHGAPDGTWTGTDAHGQALGLRWWGGLHLKAARAVPITVVCLTRAGAAGTQRDPRDTWFWWLGGRPLPPPTELVRLYPRRFSIEHGYRFDQQGLLWAATHVRTPEQMERRTQLVSAVHNELGLAREAGQVQRWPWEDATRPLTPRQVRRALPRLLAPLGTPAASPRPRGKAPGRARGAVVAHAPRHPVIRKAPWRRATRRRTA